MTRFYRHNPYLPRDQPIPDRFRIRSTEPPKCSYDIVKREDGLVDIVFVPDYKRYDIGEGRYEYDILLYTLPCVTPFDGLEENIREHYYAWAAHAEAFSRMREAVHGAVDVLIEQAATDAATAEGDYEI